ncbi:MAG: aminoglycoside phosphotransferase family protein, partial [Bacteroidia bacterium]|nr:aminoglycoside phosphotransferase family protein [Bacteroidia bacterium]
ALLTSFDIPVDTYQCEPISSGYIHASYIISTGTKPSYVLQKFNIGVFPDPESVYRNFQFASPFLRSTDYTHFDWILTQQGEPFLEDQNKNLWRLLSFVPNSQNLESIESDSQAYQSGLILGTFHRLLSQAKPNSLKEPIEKFHDLKFRLDEFENAKKTGQSERIKKVQPLLADIAILSDFLSNKPKANPVRVCHNDTKLSNIMFDKDSQEGLCLVDLDTVGPGFFYYDFGDMARTLIGTKSEDDFTEVEPELNLTYLNAMLNGIKASKLVLGKEEIKGLAYGLVLLPFLHGIRALTDYMYGDIYYKVSYPEQNWDRANQLLNFSKLGYDNLKSIIQIVNNVLEPQNL